MEEKIESKGCVIVIDEALPAGVAANAAAIIGITLGRRFPEAVGADVTDGGGIMHSGIIQIPVPVLKGALGGWLRAQGLLMLITFGELTVGFLILQVDLALLL